MFDDVELWITQAALTPWAFVLLAILILVDALFPALPSESIVISLASLYVHQQPWLLVLLMPYAAVFCWLGDNMAYLLGTTGWLQHNRLTRRPRVRRAMDWAEAELERRGSTIIIVGRFIPGGRIAINLTCGIVGFSHRAFMAATVASATLWAGYSVTVGAVAGSWFRDHKLVGITVAVLLGVVLGPLVDQLLRRTILRGDPAAGRPAPEPGPDPEHG